MSFASPEYIKMFLNNKFGKTNADSSTLLEDDALSRSTLEDVTVHRDGENHFEGPEINRNSKVRKLTHEDKKFTSKSPLQLNSSGKPGYGTSGGNEKVRKAGGNISSEQKRSASGGYQQDDQKLFDGLDPQSSASSSHSYGVDSEAMHDDEDGFASHGRVVSLDRKRNGSFEDSDADSEHCHDESDEKEQEENRKRKKALRKLVIATILCFFFMLGEILGGYFANSLAIMTDASHLLTDVSSFLVSIIALQMAARPSSKNMTFGWHRAEVIGAITSVLAIWIVTGVLVYLAVMRLIRNDYELDGKVMLITAACAIVFNIIMGIVLHENGHGHSHSHGHSHGHGHDSNKDHDHEHEGHGHEDDDHEHANSKGDRPNKSTKSEDSGNVNVRAAFIHVLGDLLQSLGVLIAAFIIYFKPEYKIADPICTFLFSILVLATTITILRDTVVIIMEGTPANINYEKVKERILSLEGVVAVHDLRIWSLTVNQSVMSCHIAIDRNMKSGQMLRNATRMLKANYNFHSMTIQVEKYSLDMDDCKKCKPNEKK